MVLFIICSFSSAIFNVLLIEATPFLTASYMAIIYTLGAFYCIWLILPSADEARVVIFAKNPEKVSNSFESNGKLALDTNANTKMPVKSGSSQGFDLLQILLRLSRLAYFPSTLVILAFYSSVRKPFDATASEQVSWFLY